MEPHPGLGETVGVHLIMSHITTNLRTQLTHRPRRPDRNQARNKAEVGFWAAGGS